VKSSSLSFLSSFALNRKKYTIIKLAGTQTDGQTKTDHDSNRSSKLMCEIHHLLQQE